MIHVATIAGYALAAVVTIGSMLFMFVVSTLSQDGDEPQ